MSTPGEDTVKLFEIVTENLDYYTNLVDKAVSKLERIDFSFESSTVSKMLSDSIREIEKGKVNCTEFLSYFRRLPQLPQPLATTTLISQKPSASRQDPSSAKIMTCCRLR